MDKARRIVESLADKFGFDEKMWGVVAARATDEVVGTDGYLTIAVGKSEEVQKKPKFLKIMYDQLFAKMKKGNYKPKDEFEAGIAKRIKDHHKVPNLDILMTEEMDGYYIVVYTDELMMYALASIKNSND